MSDKLPPQILMIESYETPEIVSTIRTTIERYSFNIVITSPELCVSQSVSINPNVIIISSKLKETTIADIARSISAKNSLLQIPLILLLEKDESVPNDILNPFVETLIHPFSPWELMTVIKTCLRKSQPMLQDKTKKYKDVSMDLSTYKVYRRGKYIHLGPTEFKILRLLLHYPREILSRKSIIEHAWDGDPKILSRTVDVHVNRIRDALKEALDNKNMEDFFIKTVRSKGYCLNLPGELEEI